MNWEDAYRQECKKLEEVRVELKEREEQICEMQLLLNRANEKLAESPIANVILSRLDAEIEKVRNSNLTNSNMKKALFYLNNIKSSAISYQEISGV